MGVSNGFYRTKKERVRFQGKQIRHSHTIEAVELSSLTERQKVLFEQKVKNGTFLDGEKITFGEFAEKWLTDYAETQLAPGTLKA